MKCIQPQTTTINDGITALHCLTQPINTALDNGTIALSWKTMFINKGKLPYSNNGGNLDPSDITVDYKNGIQPQFDTSNSGLSDTQEK